jgi:ribosome biogenesis GTPase A
MAKTRRLIKDSLQLVDAVTEILDARILKAAKIPRLQS